jgi:2-polyprenyl-3-methyl-5-hydroxy-6-metoxy-1,4-benzoquinol methylase
LAFIYETTVDPEADQNSHAFTLDIVGHNKRVLEVGCATGYFTKALRDRGCDVVGIELDADAAAAAEKWAERVVVGDLDAGALWQELEGDKFDAITFGDVLEHLRDPLAALRAAVRHLKPSGIVAISVPNIAHGDVRMALLQGEFPYHETGLLDRTHVRFFTKSGLGDMIKEAGLVLVETRRVVMPMFQTELAVDRQDVPQATINSIFEDPEAETYQFVVKAVLDNGTRTLSTLANRVNELTDQAHDEVVRTALLRKEIHDHERNQEALRAAQRELDQSRRALHESRLEAAELRQQIDALKKENEAILNTRTFRLASPLRRLYGRIHGERKQKSALSEAM